jgi:hypothetical protein
VIGGNDAAVSSGAAETSEGDNADVCVSDMLCTSLISCCCASPTEARRPPNPDIFYTMPNDLCRGNPKGAFKSAAAAAGNNKQQGQVSNGGGTRVGQASH